MYLGKIVLMNAKNHDAPRPSFWSKNQSDESFRLMKWLVLIALVVLLLLALFLPDRVLAVSDVRLLAGGSPEGSSPTVQLHKR